MYCYHVKNIQNIDSCTVIPLNSFKQKSLSTLTQSHDLNQWYLLWLEKFLNVSGNVSKAFFVNSFIQEVSVDCSACKSSPCLVGLHWNKANSVSYCWTTTLLMPELILYIAFIGVINSRFIFLKQKLLKWGIRLLFKDILQCKNWWLANYDKKCEPFSIPSTNVARS